MRTIIFFHIFFRFWWNPKKNIGWQSSRRSSVWTTWDRRCQSWNENKEQTKESNPERKKEAEEKQIAFYLWKITRKKIDLFIRFLTWAIKYSSFSHKKVASFEEEPSRICQHFILLLPTDARMCRIKYNIDLVKFMLMHSDVVQPLAFLYLLNAYSAMVYLLFIFVGGGHLFYHCYDMDIFDRKFFIQYYRNNIFVAQQNSFSWHFFGFFFCLFRLEETKLKVSSLSCSLSSNICLLRYVIPKLAWTSLPLRFGYSFLFILYFLPLCAVLYHKSIPILVVLPFWSLCHYCCFIPFQNTCK